MSSKFNLVGRHVDITPALDKYIRNKLGKVESMFDIVTKINVIVTIEKHGQKAEAELKVAGDSNGIFAEATTEDMYKSVDELEHKIMRQVKDYHARMIERKEHREKDQ
jgi:putative sigma-54 modulation protein